MSDIDQLARLCLMTNGAAVSFMTINYPYTLTTSYCNLPFAQQPIPLKKPIVRSNGSQSLLHIAALTELTITEHARLTK